MFKRTENLGLDRLDLEIQFELQNGRVKVFEIEDHSASGFVGLLYVLGQCRAALD